MKHECPLGERCDRSTLCCRRIAHATGDLAKARAALVSFIESGGYDHWGDVEKYATAAASAEIEFSKHGNGPRIMTRPHARAEKESQ